MVVGVGLLPILAVTAIVHHSIDGLRERETSRVAESARIVADHIDSEVSAQVQNLRAAASVALPGAPTRLFKSFGLGSKSPRTF